MVVGMTQQGTFAAATLLPSRASFLYFEFYHVWAQASHKCVVWTGDLPRSAWKGSDNIRVETRLLCDRLNVLETRSSPISESFPNTICVPSSGGRWKSVVTVKHNAIAVDLFLSERGRSRMI
jgi:hypothetical protein